MSVKRLWVWREVVPSDAPGDYYTGKSKLKTTGRAFVMESEDEDEGTNESIGVFDSLEGAVQVVET